MQVPLAAEFAEETRRKSFTPEDTETTEENTERG
jgi:hypothetical protein